MPIITDIGMVETLLRWAIKNKKKKNMDKLNCIIYLCILCVCIHIYILSKMPHLKE